MILHLKCKNLDFCEKVTKVIFRSQITWISMFCKKSEKWVLHVKTQKFWLLAKSDKSHFHMSNHMNFGVLQKIRKVSFTCENRKKFDCLIKNFTLGFRLKIKILHWLIEKSKIFDQFRDLINIKKSQIYMWKYKNSDFLQKLGFTCQNAEILTFGKKWEKLILHMEMSKFWVLTKSEKSHFYMSRHMNFGVLQKNQKNHFFTCENTKSFDFNQKILHWG